MRELGFSVMWPKLGNDIFTTFRFERKDAPLGRDWKVEEVVKVVFRPRVKNQRKVLGVARKQLKDLEKTWLFMPGIAKNTPDMITPDEAYDDGFIGQHGGGDVGKMKSFLRTTSPDKYRKVPLYKYTLYWVSRGNHDNQR